jgi:hypothetical protein
MFTVQKTWLVVSAVQCLLNYCKEILFVMWRYIHIYIGYTANNLNLNSKYIVNFCGISKFLFISFLYTKISSGNRNDSLQNPGCKTLN